VSARIAHVEFAGPDGGRLEGFYEGLFGWKSRRERPAGHDYGRFAPGGDAPPSGGIRHEPGGPAEVVVYVAVPDVSASADRAVSLGGRIRIAPLSAGDRDFAVIEDPAGNPVGLIEDADG
jgi:predicted enzyme related to lactoylglutathione lyase